MSFINYFQHLHEFFFYPGGFLFPIRGKLPTLEAAISADFESSL